MTQFLQNPNLVVICAIGFLLGIGLIIGQIIFKRIQNERDLQTRIEGGNSYENFSHDGEDETGVLEKLGGHYCSANLIFALLALLRA